MPLDHAPRDAAPLDADLLAAAHAWRAVDPDPDTRKELDDILARQDGAALQACFGQRLGFGTAGIRGRRGPGPGCLNRVVARQVAAGVGHTVLADFGDAKERGVVIGFDGRHGSRAYAQDAAAVLAAQGVPVRIFDEVVPTPVLAHAVPHLACAAGIMVTASHNPPQDNGIKVYWEHGGQIVPPLDGRISAAIEAAAAAGVDLPDFAALRADGLILGVPPGQLDAYLHAVLELRVHKVTGARSVYSAMHGVGWATLDMVLKSAGHLQPAAVASQRDPDGDFPTVALPNPEEPGALDLAMRLATQEDADVILANDPDADRLAVAIPDGKGGWRGLSGNEVGLLLAEDLLAHRRPHPGENPPLVATTIVSSSLLGDIAAAHGAVCAEVLTGFKWLAQAALAYDGDFVLGYEEALGYSAGAVVRDKDGVSAAMLVLDLVSWLKADGRTLSDALDDLARKYGVAASSQRSLVLPGAEGQAEIAARMAALRAAPPTELGGAAVRRIRDVLDGTVRDLQTGKVSALDLPSSNVLAFDLADGCRVLARPSGTEPKLKLYFEARRKVGADGDVQAARVAAQARLQELSDEVWARVVG